MLAIETFKKIKVLFHCYYSLKYICYIGFQRVIHGLNFLIKIQIIKKISEVCKLVIGYNYFSLEIKENCNMVV